MTRTLTMRDFDLFCLEQQVPGLRLEYPPLAANLNK
jgi:hypothetical protein